MKPVYHVAISAGLSACILVFFKSWAAALGCFLSGIFIDLDHHIDYLIFNRKVPTYRELFDFCANPHKGKLYLFFHSYELLTILWLIIYVFNLGIVWAAVAIGLTVHMLCDQLSNPLKPFGYFMLYRVKYAFDKRFLLTEDYVKSVS